MNESFDESLVSWSMASNDFINLVSNSGHWICSSCSRKLVWDGNNRAGCTACNGTRCCIDNFGIKQFLFALAAKQWCKENYTNNLQMLKKGKTCNVRESNPGLPRGRREFYHWTNVAWDAGLTVLILKTSHSETRRLQKVVFNSHLWSGRNKQRWFSGRILACHAGGPGSIPGRCKLLFFQHIPLQRFRQ